MKLPKIESRALRYGYSNARVRAMKGMLINSAMLNEMVRVGNIEAMIELLQRSSYKNDLAQAAVTSAAAGDSARGSNRSSNHTNSQIIELAVARNFGRVVEQLINVTPKGDRSLLQALLLKWDLMNLKTLVHAKELKQEYEDVQAYLFQVGGLDEDDFRRIMKADDRTLLTEVKRTRLGQQILSPASAQFNKKMSRAFTRAFSSVDAFMEREATVDAYIYLLMDMFLSGGSSPSSSNSRNLSRNRDGLPIRHILKKEIDAKNVMIIERLKRRGVDRGKITASLIHGGTLGSSFVTRLIETKDVGATAALLKSCFKKLDLSDNPTLTSLEIALEKSIAAQKVLAFHQAVLSVGVIAGFLLLKEEEMNNLRKIAKGKEYGMSEADVRDMLVVV